MDSLTSHPISNEMLHPHFRSAFEQYLSWYLSFKKGSRDLLATWQEAISQKNCDKILKERRVFESGSLMMLT